MFFLTSDVPRYFFQLNYFWEVLIDQNVEFGSIRDAVLFLHNNLDFCTNWPTYQRRFKSEFSPLGAQNAILRTLKFIFLLSCSYKIQSVSKVSKLGTRKNNANSRTI